MTESDIKITFTLLPPLVRVGLPVHVTAGDQHGEAKGFLSCR